MVRLRATEAETIEAAKEALKEVMDDLLRTLNDVHWIVHNEQHDEDHSIPDAEWAEIVQRSEKAELLVSEKGAAVRIAVRALEAAQRHFTSYLQARIAKLDLAIAPAS